MRARRPRVAVPPSLALLMLIAVGCTRGQEVGFEEEIGAPDPRASSAETTAELKLRELAPGVWLHTTVREFPAGSVPSNGLVVADGDSLLLVDSAWGDRETEVLVERIERELRRPIRLMLVTHHHEDRLSGTRYLHARGIPVVAHALTRSLVTKDVRPPAALSALASVGDVVPVGPVEVFYPGPGHTLDNVVVWIPSAGVLFGGCLIRPLGSSSLGNVADADLDGWPEAVARTRERYANARVVVSGHGPPAGRAALEHTAVLLSEAPGSRPPRP